MKLDLVIAAVSIGAALLLYLFADAIAWNLYQWLYFDF